MNKLAEMSNPMRACGLAVLSISLAVGAALFCPRKGKVETSLLAFLGVVLGLGPVFTKMYGLTLVGDERLLQILNPFHKIDQDPFLALTISDAGLLRRVTRPEARCPCILSPASPAPCRSRMIRLAA